MSRIITAVLIASGLEHFVVSAQRASERRSNGVLLENLTWVEAKDRLSADTVVVIALGAAAKEHGPHLKLANDWIMAENFKRRLMEHADVVVAPTVELDGALKSWAVPKGPSLDPDEKRLAVHVEDHPLDYGKLEGVIPEGNYGAGRVVLWDLGTWTPEGDARAAYAKGRLAFRLDGEKLQGSWRLVRMRGDERDKHDNWLLIKHGDDAARAPRAKGARASHSAERAADKITKRARVRRGKKVALPSLIAPQLATLVETPPAEGDWLYEIKYDGYRMLARIEAGEASLYSRNGYDWTGKLGGVAAALSELETDHAWLDGEVVVLDVHGVSSFQALQNAFERRSDSGVLYFVFDLLYEGGIDLRALPLVERKQRLRKLLDDAGSPLVLYSEHLTGSADEALAAVCQMRLEGLIGKRSDAAYLSGRSRSWIKVKCRKRQEFVVGGYTDPKGSRQGFGALLLGLHDKDGALRYVGRVGSGFDDRALQQLNPPRPKGREGLHWVRPSLVAEVNFTSWTDEGLLRQASFLGLRNDKPARAVTREAVVQADANGGNRKKAKRAGSSAARGTSEDGVVRVAGVALSNPDRVLYADQGITKTDLARYYEDVAEWVMPHLVHRPLSIVRCPQGSGKTCFFQKHLNAASPAGITPIQLEESDGAKDTYFMADELQGLIALAQLGVLELHTWGSTAPRIERPDRVTFDLDPDPALSWKTLTDGTLLVKALLDELGLRSFLKTTGGKGLHIVVPLARKHTWNKVKGFSHAVAAHLAREIPQYFTANMAKQRRKGKIFIDYLRNGRGSTAVAAYSTRAQPGAPVSVPLAWTDLNEDVRGDHFNITTVRARLLKLRRDPWADYESVRHTITAGMKRSLGIK